jgi:hypothetical protein
MGSSKSKDAPDYMHIFWKDEDGNTGSGVFDAYTDWVDGSDMYPGGQHKKVKLVKIEFGDLPPSKAVTHKGKDAPSPEFYIMSNDYRNTDWLIYDMVGYKKTCPKMVEVTHCEEDYKLPIATSLEMRAKPLEK